MGYYLVLAFAAAHFVAMFGWSNLGLISAVHGANAIESSGLPLPILLGLIVLFSAMINLFVGSASAKWALLAPVMVPMLMLLGISPDGATAVYRVGHPRLCAALAERFRPRQLDRNDVALFDLDADYRRASRRRLGLPRLGSRTGCTDELYTAGSVIRLSIVTASARWRVNVI